MSDSNNSEVGVAHFYVRSSTAWRQVLLSQSVLLSIPHDGVGIVHSKFRWKEGQPSWPDVASLKIGMWVNIYDDER